MMTWWSEESEWVAQQGGHLAPRGPPYPSSSPRPTKLQYQMWRGIYCQQGTSSIHHFSLPQLSNFAFNQPQQRHVVPHRHSTHRVSCNWISLRVPFWLSVWKQNSVAKHYFFFMSLLLYQGSGINFGHFIRKSPFGFPTHSLKSSKTNNETTGTEERNKVLGFLLVAEFISLLFQLAPIFATRQTSKYILWKKTMRELRAQDMVLGSTGP